MYDEVAECPECGTTRLVIRKRRDPIDRHPRGLRAWWHKKMGATLYHCIFCRLQFYSRLPLCPPSLEDTVVQPAEAPAFNRQS
jgi:DNA-directed RNA polymerase subunit RPC12/RpoP